MKLKALGFWGVDSGRVIEIGREEYNQNLLCECMNEFSTNKNITLQNSESHNIISQKSRIRLALVQKKKGSSLQRKQRKISW